MIAPTYYVLRYGPNVPMERRKHAATIGRHPSWVDAEDHRLTLPNASDLEVEGPREKQ